MTYLAGNPPATYDAQWLQKELQKIREAIASPEPFTYIDKQYVAPVKPREGMMVLADGVKWNPGRGAGYYGYVNGGWKPSGLPANGLTKADVGLGNVDNTSDANKPISTATQTALNGKASLSGATFTGTITAPAVISTSSLYAAGGNVALDGTGNVFGSVWGGWLSGWLSAQLASKVSVVAIDRAGLDGGDPNKPCMASGATVVYMIRNLNGSLISGNRQNGYLEWNTNIGVVGTTYFSSDLRMKRDITPSTEKALPLLRKMKFYSFRYREESGFDPATLHKAAVIAQDLQQLNPAFVLEVKGNEDRPGYLMPDLLELLNYTMKALAETNERIDALEAEYGRRSDV